MAQREQLLASGGTAQGYHGTSANSARTILQHGFENRHPSRIDQESAVYFTNGTDEDTLAGAKQYGINKALWQGEREYAVFAARFRNPEPDFATGQNIWAVQAHNIIEYSVAFYAIPNDIQPTPIMKIAHAWHGFWSGLWR